MMPGKFHFPFITSSGEDRFLLKQKYLMLQPDCLLDHDPAHKPPFHLHMEASLNKSGANFTHADFQF